MLTGLVLPFVARAIGGIERKAKSQSRLQACSPEPKSPDKAASHQIRFCAESSFLRFA